MRLTAGLNMSHVTRIELNQHSIQWATVPTWSAIWYSRDGLVSESVICDGQWHHIGLVH